MGIIGDKNQVLTLQRPGDATLDTSGSQGEPDYRDVATVWGEWIPASGEERVQAAAVQAVLTGRFKVWHRPDITSGWRVVWNGQAYQITAVVPDGRSDELVLDVVKAS